MNDKKIQKQRMKIKQRTTIKKWKNQKKKKMKIGNGKQKKISDMNKEGSE